MGSATDASFYRETRKTLILKSDITEREKPQSQLLRNREDCGSIIL